MAAVTALQATIDTKRFGQGPLVLEGLELAVPSGEISALVGPSGAGKTTLLRLLAGLDDQYSGTIGLGATQQQASPRVGMVFQEPRLLPWLTLRANIALVLDDAEAESEWIDELLTSVGLADRGQAWPNQLSGGMCRRAALARAFAVRPELLLLDEPFVSLDAPAAGRQRALLQRLWQHRQPTVLLVSHDMEDALALADRIFFLSETPARVLLEQPLPSPDIAGRRRRQITDQLLSTHPGLLAGRLDGQCDPETGTSG